MHRSQMVTCTAHCTAHRRHTNVGNVVRTVDGRCFNDVDTLGTLPPVDERCMCVDGHGALRHRNGRQAVERRWTSFGRAVTGSQTSHCGIYPVYRRNGNGCLTPTERPERQWCGGHRLLRPCPGLQRSRAAHQTHICRSLRTFTARSTYPRSATRTVEVLNMFKTSRRLERISTYRAAQLPVLPLSSVHAQFINRISTYPTVLPKFSEICRTVQVRRPIR